MKLRCLLSLFRSFPGLMLAFDGDGGGGGGSAGLQQEAQAAFKARDAAKREALELRDRLDKLEQAAHARTEEQARKKASKEDARIKADGEYQEKLASMETEFTHRLRQAELRARESAEASVRSSVAAAIRGIESVVPDAAPDITGQAMVHIGLDERFQPFVKGPDGGPLMRPDDPTQQVTVEEFVQGFIKDRPWFLKDTQPKRPGGRPSGGGGQVNWSIDRAAKDPAYAAKWREADPEGYKQAWAAHIRTLDGKTGSWK